MFSVYVPPLDSNANLKKAVEMYLNRNEPSAEYLDVRAKHGDVIGSWDVSAVTDFSGLFSKYSWSSGGSELRGDFNEDIS